MAFVMVLSYSRQVFLHFFPDARMANFLRGHVGALGATPIPATQRRAVCGLRSSFSSNSADWRSAIARTASIITPSGTEPIPSADCPLCRRISTTTDQTEAPHGRFGHGW